MSSSDLIFVSLENWDDMWRRNQFVCEELARRHPRRRILFVAPARDVSAAVRQGDLSGLRGPVTRSVAGRPNITITRPLKLLPNSAAPGRKVNEAMARAHVRAAARKLGLRSPILWLNPHEAVHMAGRMGESTVIYDITDDWTHASQREAVRRRTIRQDAELCRKADAVIVCSQGLYDSRRSLVEPERLHLIPNGVDARHYRQVLDGDGPLPPLAADWRRPVLGYTGTIHPDRLDVDLVEAVARRMPEATVVLLGPNHLSEADRGRLQACGNVRMPGPVPYEALPDHMRAFDACIVPHRVTPFTESLNPIKLWEYLAAGKPIISTPVAGFRDHPEHVHLATDAADFVAALRRALDEDASRPEHRRAEAQRHAWASRVDQVEHVLRDCSDRRSAAEPRQEVACA